MRVPLRLRLQHIQVLVELAQRVLQKRVRRDTNLANYRGPVYLPTLYFRQSARAQRLDAVLPADFSLQRSPAKKVRRHVATPACVLLLPVACGGSPMPRLVLSPAPVLLIDTKEEVSCVPQRKVAAPEGQPAAVTWVRTRRQWRRWLISSCPRHPQVRPLRLAVDAAQRWRLTL